MRKQLTDTKFGLPRYTVSRSPSLLVVAAVLSVSLAANAGNPDTVNYDWPIYAQNARATKYADLDQINRDTVKDLQLAWTWASVDNAATAARPAHIPALYKSTPIKIGRTLYISTSLGSVVALDAVTGAQKWTFDTHTWEHDRHASQGFNHRGVAYWESGDKRRILMGTNNAFLWSLDADTGIPDQSFGTGGKIDLTQGLGRPVLRLYYSSVAAPMIVDDTVVMGASVSDIPYYKMVPRKRSDIPPGHVRGFDVRSGRQKWIFHSIPQAGEPGNETWERDSWKDTGGANVWTLMSADLELGYVYLPFGSANNDFYGGHRLGDNLYANSLVCLEAATGKLVWSYQLVHHDLWNYDIPAAPNLVDITVEGKPIKAVAQVTKQGFVFVFDRVTGEPVWPIEERPVPRSKVPGERAATTQPFPTRPAPFELQGITEDDLIDFTPRLRAEALEMIGKFEHEGLFTPPSIKGTIQVPGPLGGANWGGAAVDPETAVLYVPSFSAPGVVQLYAPAPGTTEYNYVRDTGAVLRVGKRLPITKPPYSRISAINLHTGNYEWVVPNGDGIRQNLIDAGIPDPGPVGSITLSSPLLTKSLLFVTATKGQFLLRALDKTSGAAIHEIELPGKPGGAPMTYMVDGRQYISVAVGGLKDARLVTWALK